MSSEDPQAAVAGEGGISQDSARPSTTSTSSTAPLQTQPTTSRSTSSYMDPVNHLFSADHKDLALIAYYSAVLKLFDGGGGNLAPTKCTDAEIIVDWLAFVAATIIYGARHFVLKKIDRPLWLRVARCLVFMVYLLSTHSQPIACSLSESADSDDLHTLSYIQGAVQLTLAIIATQMLVKQATSGRGEPEHQHELPLA